MWVFVGVFVLLLGSAQSEAGTGNHSQRRNHHSNAQRLADIDRYVALGDSFTSGAGIPPAARSGCFRSVRNYPRRVAERLSPGPGLELVDASCGAAGTVHAEVAQTYLASNPPQLVEVNARTDLVTVSLGLNDVGYWGLITQCEALAPNDPTGAPCQASFQTPQGDMALAGMVAVRDSLTRVLELAKSRAPRAQVMLVGYPQLVPESGTCPELPFATGDYAYVRQFFVALDATMRQAARLEGVTYIDVLTASDGHDVCAGRDAWVLGAIPSTRSTPYHPFANEQRAIAAMVVAALR